MAKISNPNLEIKHNHEKKTARVIVTASVTFDPLEQFLIKNGLKLKLHAALWGADSGLKGDDDHLFTFAPKSFPDATPSSTEKVVFDVTLGEGKLNEDVGFLYGTDEIYARLKLVDQYTGREYVKRTNEVSHDF